MTEYTGWNQPLIVTLTATSNPYLKDRLPLRGRLTVHEMRTDGFAQPTRMTFQEIDAQNRLVAAPVMVDGAEFIYTGPNCPKTGRSASVCEDPTHAACPDLRSGS